VTLEAGGGHLAGRWLSVPSAPGLDAAAILTAAAAGQIDVLILLGADPLGDFPDRDLAARGLAGARTVIALDQFVTPSVAGADVVFPVAGFTEVEGTSTNLEGRVSVLHQKVTAPGTARPDWIVAAELALRLGADLGLESVEGIRAEIAELAPAYVGLTTECLAADDARDGLVVPLAEPPSGLVTFTPGPAGAPPALDSYSLRLVVTRKLYDEGTLVQRSSSLAGLAPGTILRVNPYDFDRLGVANGDQVRVHSSRAETTAEIAADAGVPRGSASLRFNQPGLTASALIDARARVNDIRVESGGV